MPPTETLLTVQVRSDSGKTSSGKMRMQHWDKKDRTKRASKFWLYCWALSLVSIIIPIAHFFLVPGFLIAGPVGAWVISTQRAALTGGESTCPECGAVLPLSPASDNWPLTDLCAQCQCRVKIEKA